MKKIIAFILLFIMLVNTQTIFVCASVELELIINGVAWNGSDLSSISLSEGEHHILAPADKLTTALGAELIQNADIIEIENADTKIVFINDSKIATVNDVEKNLDVAPCLIEGVQYIPAEFCGVELGFHTLRERAGNRIRIISRTSTTAPAVPETIKPGMAELVSTVHRNIPTEFEKTSELSDLIYNCDDYTGAVKNIGLEKSDTIPDGTLIFTQEDFVAEADKSNDGSADWYDDWCITEVVDSVLPEGRTTMSVKMAGLDIGRGDNITVPFEEALQLNITETMGDNFNGWLIKFAKQLPSPTANDNYILSFYARLIDGGDPDFGTGKFAIQVQGPGMQKSINEVVDFGKNWKRFDFLLTGVEGATEIRFNPAYYQQIIQIAGFEIKDVGQDADVSYFTPEKIDLLPQELAPDAEWREDALDRIEEVRKGDFTVEVKDSNGNPVSGAEVEFDMFEHEFKFGIQMDIEYVADEILNGYGYGAGENGNQEAKFISLIGSDFNSMVVGNRLKWDVYAMDKLNNPDKTSTAQLVIDEAKKQGIKYVRGHALWMPANSYTGYPEELYNLLTSTEASWLKYMKFKNYVKEHFAEMNREFPDIYEWDVTNETHGRTFFTDVFGEKIFTDIYKIANEQLTNGQSKMLCDNQQFNSEYWDRLDNFKKNNISFDAFAMQGHSGLGSIDMNNNHRPTKALEVWDRFAYEYQKTFAITEFSVQAYKDEYGYNGQGDYLRDMLIAAYSHPACTGFNIWWLSGYWSDYDSSVHEENPKNNGNGAGPAPLYTIRFEEKPGLAQFRDLLYNKWWTRDAKSTTNSSGRASVNGYYGDYDVTVRINGEIVKTDMAAFHKGYENILTITID